jgi:hypothetical protein
MCGPGERGEAGLTGIAFATGATHGSTARMERAEDSVEVLSRGPKSAVAAPNEVRLSFDTG